MPGVDIKYPNAVFGYAANVPFTGDIVSDFIASAAVAVGQVVIFDTANFGQVKPATASTDSHAVVGVAASAATAAGQAIQVVQLGYAVASSNTVITANDRVGADGTTAGNVATVVAGTGLTTNAGLGLVVGIALESVTAGATSVRVYVKPL